MNEPVKSQRRITRGIGNNRGSVALLGSPRAQGENRRPGVSQEKRPERSGNQTQTNHDNGKTNHRRGKLKGIIAMLKSFCDLFKKKQEESMERRAEESRRKADEVVNDIYDKTHHDLDVNLDNLVDEITSKKNHG